MYIVPKNVKARFEFFEGFGWKEFFITLIGVAIGLAITLFLLLFSQSLFIYLPVAIGGVIGFFLSHTEPRSGFSPLSYIRGYRHYQSSTNLYFYIRGGDRR